MPSMTEQLRTWLLTPVLARIEQLEIAMATREETAYANLTANIESVKTGWASLKTENEQLRTALQEADAAKVQAVDDALAADSDHDAAAIEAADASLAELVAQPAPEPQPEPAPEPTPEVPADTPVEAPVDNGDQPA